MNGKVNEGQLFDINVWCNRSLKTKLHPMIVTQYRSVGTVLSWLTARDCNNITPPLTILDKVVKLMKGHPTIDLIWSIHLVLGLPGFLLPSTQPCIMTFSKEFPPRLAMCPKYFIIWLWTWDSKRLFWLYLLQDADVWSFHKPRDAQHTLPTPHFKGSDPRLVCFC